MAERRRSWRIWQGQTGRPISVYGRAHCPILAQKPAQLAATKDCAAPCAGQCADSKMLTLPSDAALSTLATPQIGALIQRVRTCARKPWVAVPTGPVIAAARRQIIENAPSLHSTIAAGGCRGGSPNRAVSNPSRRWFLAGVPGRRCSTQPRVISMPATPLCAENVAATEPCPTVPMRCGNQTGGSHPSAARSLYPCPSRCAPELFVGRMRSRALTHLCTQLLAILWPNGSASVCKPKGFPDAWGNQTALAAGRPIPVPRRCAFWIPPPKYWQDPPPAA